MLKLSQTEYAAIRQHGEDTYPHECCGVLLGSVNLDTDTRVVQSVVRAGNTRTDSPHNRYSIDPAELIRIQMQGRKRGEDIIGFYHSHPDHPAMWSSTDLAEAHWIGCSYVITSVDGDKTTGKAVFTKSWVLYGSPDGSAKQLEEEEMIVQNPEQ